MGFYIFTGNGRSFDAKVNGVPKTMLRKQKIEIVFLLTVFIAITGFLFIPDCYGTCCTGEIKPKSGATSYNTYLWDGKKLRAKSGATSRTTWLFDGKEVRKESGATSSNTYLWSGAKFKPKSGATSANTWMWARNKLKPRSGAKASNTWVFDRCEWTLKQGADPRNSWVITGFVPVPISALVILGLN
jgi:hypothetical protein